MHVDHSWSTSTRDLPNGSRKELHDGRQVNEARHARLQALLLALAFPWAGLTLEEAHVEDRPLDTNRMLVPSQNLGQNNNMPGHMVLKHGLIVHV